MEMDLHARYGVDERVVNIRTKFSPIFTKLKKPRLRLRQWSTADLFEKMMAEAVEHCCLAG